MTAKLIQHGDSWALVLDPETVTRAGLDPTQSVDITIDGHSLIITPIADQQRQSTFEAALAEPNEQFGEALRRLAE